MFFNIPSETFQWYTVVIYFNLIPRGFCFFKRGEQQKMLKNQKPLRRRLQYLWNFYLFSMTLVQRIVFMHYSFKDILWNIQGQLKKWTLSKKNWKKKIGVNIWSTDSQFFKSRHLGGATNSTNKGKGRVQDPSQNCRATALLIYIFPSRIYFWMNLCYLQ